MERKLTAKQQRFVEEYLRNGGQQTQAAQLAGYAPGIADDMASRLVRNPLIQKALAIQTVATLGLYAIPALHRVRTLVDHSRSDYVKLEAAKDLLDRAGFGKPDRGGLGGDTSLTVELHLGTPQTLEGGSKRELQRDGDHPDAGKSALELDLAPVAAVFRGEGELAGAIATLPAIVEETRAREAVELPDFLVKRPVSGSDF